MLATHRGGTNGMYGMETKAMANATVDRDAAVPLYHQIFLTLRDDIFSGRLPFGASVPTEHELGESYGVSRITARRALHELAEYRLVERRRRTGTRVIYRSPTRPIEANIDQAVETLIAFGRNTGVKVVEIGEERANADVAGAMGIDPDTPVVRAVRVRWLDNAPLGQVVSYVPVRLGHLITPANLTGTPMLALLHGEGHKIRGARQTISALLADNSLAAALEIEARAPILRIERVVTGEDGTPLLLTVASYRADRYRINLDLHGSQN